jgi:hypothetical protein
MVFDLSDDDINEVNNINLITKQVEYIDYRVANFPDDPFVMKLKPVREQMQVLREELAKLEDEEEKLGEDLLDDAFANGTDERVAELRRLAAELPDDVSSVTSDDLKPLESDDE